MCRLSQNLQRWSKKLSLWTLILNITLVKLEAVQQRATQGITKSDDDYDTRLSKLKLLSLSNKKLMRDVTFLFNIPVINLHYDKDISNKLLLCRTGI